jgi:hypothetical protein
LFGRGQLKQRIQVCHFQRSSEVNGHPQQFGRRHETHVLPVHKEMFSYPFVRIGVATSSEEVLVTHTVESTLQHKHHVGIAPLGTLQVRSVHDNRTPLCSLIDARVLSYKICHNKHPLRNEPHSTARNISCATIARKSTFPSSKPLDQSKFGSYCRRRG